MEIYIIFAPVAFLSRLKQRCHCPRAAKRFPCAAHTQLLIQTFKNMHRRIDADYSSDARISLTEWQLLFFIKEKRAAAAALSSWLLADLPLQANYDSLDKTSRQPTHKGVAAAHCRLYLGR